MRALQGVLLGPALVMAFVSAAKADSKGFRDWLAACDNVKSCTALSLPAEGGDDVAYLRLTRPAGPAGALALAIRIRAETLKAPLDIALALDGAAFPAAGRRFAATIADGADATIALPPADAEALIAAARKATKLTVAIAGKSLDISLAGSVAAMLWIDEQQGRLNTTSALIRKGPGTAVPAALPLPSVPATVTKAPAIAAAAGKALTTALRRQVNRRNPDSCEDDLAGMDQVWPLDAGLRLVGLACSRGAYNLSTYFWIVPGSGIAKASKAGFDELADNVLVNADYDPATGRLGYFDKARGIGDCGVQGAYSWTGSGFAILERSEMGECRQIPPDDWPVTYRGTQKTVP